MKQLTAIGNLTKDATVRETKNALSEKKIIVFDIAVNTRSQSNDSTMYLQVSHWVTKDAVLQYLKKGVKVLVQGDLTVHEWTNKEGNKRTSIGVRADKINILTWKRNDENQQANTEGDLHTSNDIDDTPF